MCLSRNESRTLEPSPFYLGHTTEEQGGTLARALAAPRKSSSPVRPEPGPRRGRRDTEGHSSSALPPEDPRPGAARTPARPRRAGLPDLPTSPAISQLLPKPKQHAAGPPGSASDVCTLAAAFPPRPPKAVLPRRRSSGGTGRAALQLTGGPKCQPHGPRGPRIPCPGHARRAWAGTGRPCVGTSGRRAGSLPEHAQHALRRPFAPLAPPLPPHARWPSSARCCAATWTQPTAWASSPIVSFYPSWRGAHLISSVA